MITATFKNGKEDVLAMSMHYYASSPTVRRSMILARAGIPFPMVVVAAVAFFRDPGYPALGMPLLLLAAAWAIFYPRWHREYQRYTIEKLFEESSYQKAFGTYTVNLDEHQIASSSPTGTGTYPWSSVSRISLSPDHLFIFLAGAQGYAIPRAQVPEATIQEMKAFAEQRLGRTL